MYKAINLCRPGAHFSEIGMVIEEHAWRNGYYVNKDFGGHGIAHELHLPPTIHHHMTPMQNNAVMKPGMAFTIEPVIMLDDRYDNDNPEME